MIPRALLLIVFFLFYGMPVQTLSGESKKGTPAPVNQTGPSLLMEGSGTTLPGVMEGEKPEHTFTLVNQGTKEMRIRVIRPWKRTDILSANRVLAPGGRGKIEVALDTRGLGGTFTGGVTLLTTDRARPRYRMSVSVPVTPLIAVSPDRLFINVEDGNRRSSRVSITPNTEKPLELKPHKMPPEDDVAWTLSPKSTGKGFVLTAEIKSMADAAYRDRLIFTTNYPGRPVLVVPLLVRSPPAVQVLPEKVDLGTVLLPATPSGDKKPLSMLPASSVHPVFIRMNRNSGLVVESIRADSSALAWTLDTVIPGQVYRMDLRPLSAAMKPGPLKAALTVTTNQPGPPLVIPVTASGRIYEPSNAAVATQKHE